jgi:hypothetical protein
MITGQSIGKRAASRVVLILPNIDKLGIYPVLRSPRDATILPSLRVSMSASANENPPVLICSECRRRMEFLAALPELANLPAVYAYRCLPCHRVGTIELKRELG